MNLLEGQVAIVTGAGNGIGSAVAELLAREGADIVANDLGTGIDGAGADPTIAAAAAEKLTASGRRAVASNHDVADARQAEELVRLALQTFGRLDVLVNCAGVQSDHAILNLNAQAWSVSINAQLTGTFNCIKAAAGAMRSSTRGGRIVNTTSSSGLLGTFGQCASASASAGVYGLTRCAAMELQRHGIMVNAVAPLARTRQTEDLPMFQKGNALTADHVAPIYLYLASNLAGDITGQILSAAGGRISVYRMTESHSRFKDVDAGLWTAEEIAKELSEIPRA